MPAPLNETQGVAVPKKSWPVGMEPVPLPCRSEIGRTARCVTDAKNDDPVPLNAIPDDVRVGADQLTHVGSRNGTTPVREVFEAVAFGAQGVGNVHSGTRVEFENVIVSEGDAIQGRLSPDNLHESGTRRLGSFALGEFYQPFANPPMLNIAACRVSRLSLGIEAGFMRRVRLHIENRLCLSVSHKRLLQPGLYSAIRSELQQGRCPLQSAEQGTILKKCRYEGVRTCRNSRLTLCKRHHNFISEGVHT